MTSQAYEDKREAKEAVAVWTVKVSFPAFESLEARDFFWATSAIEVDGEDFLHKLTAVPTGRHQRDRGNDYAEFSASNPNNALYNDFYPYEDLIERAEVLIKECYEIDYGYFESEIRFFGYLKDFSLDESSKTLNFTAMSDLSRTGFLVGGRILTRERCGTGFNVNGLLAPDAPDFDPCGWQTIQGGNPLFCSKFLKGVDGCESHNNTHRFYAVKGLSDAKVEQISGNATGFDYHSGPTCFIAGTFVVMADWTLKPIERIVPRIDYIMGFDKMTGELVSAMVWQRFKHSVTEYENAVFARERRTAIIGVRKEHLVNVEDGVFKPYGAIIGGKVQGVTKDGKRVQINSIASETVVGDVDVYNLQTASGTFHTSDDSMEIIIKWSNSKAHTTVQ